VSERKYPTYVCHSQKHILSWSGLKEVLDENAHVLKLRV
jgi:hypothetical protein